MSETKTIDPRYRGAVVIEDNDCEECLYLNGLAWNKRNTESTVYCGDIADASRSIRDCVCKFQYIELTEDQTEKLSTDQGNLESWPETLEEIETLIGEKLPLVDPTNNSQSGD